MPKKLYVFMQRKGGGLFYMIGSGWDLSLSNSGMYPQSMFFYHSIWIFGPLVYLLNR